MAPQVQPPHIGILCDYGFTLLPKSGIGVFVYNLIDGLLTLVPSASYIRWLLTASPAASCSSSKTGRSAARIA